MSYFKQLLSKPAANDVERPRPPSAERREHSLRTECASDAGCQTAPVEGERLAA